MTSQGKNTIDVLLADAIKALAVKQPIEKITIKEITDMAGVIRPTFYNHFQDKYELLEWIINTELLEPIYPLMQNEMLTEAMVLLFSNMEREKPFYSRAARLEGAVNFSDLLMRCIRAHLEQILKGMRTGRGRHPWLSPEILAAYYSQSMSFMIMEWIKRGMNVTPKEMAEAYTFVISHSMTELVKNL